MSSPNSTEHVQKRSEPRDRLSSITGHLQAGEHTQRGPLNTKYVPEYKEYEARRPVKAIILGAGIAGIATAVILKHKVPNLSFTVYDKNDSVGGTWAENTYPGVRCDVPSHCYQLTFEPNPHWTEFYASGKEIREYYEFVVQKHDVASHLKLSHEIVRAQWSDSQWHVEVKNTKTGEVFRDQAEFLITAAGRLNHWVIPNIPGLNDVYQGHLRHTSNWDHSYNYTDKRVAVIGNGASGMQVIPNLFPKVAHLDHYIRSKVWISPFFRGTTVTATADQPGGPEYSAEQRAEFASNPAAYLAYRKDLETTMHGGFRGGVKGSEENHATRALWLKVMTERVGRDPIWIEKLVPEYAPGCKRPTPAPGYLETLIKPKATFISSPIIRATAKGLITTEVVADGTAHEVEREVDAIIAATGHANGFVPRFPTIGLDNVDLQQKWATDGPIGYPETYFGLMAPGFPNYFFVMQAQGNGAGGTVPLGCETTATYIAKCIRKVQSESYNCLHPKDEATADFNNIVNGYFDDKVLGDSCNSWFKQGEGNTRNLLSWPGSAHHKFDIARVPRWEDFEFGRQKGSERNRYEYFGNGWTTREKSGQTDTWTNYLKAHDDINIAHLHEAWDE